MPVPGPTELVRTPCRPADAEQACRSRIRGAQLPARRTTGRRRRVEGQPPVAGEPGLHPGMGFVVGDGPHAAFGVVRPAREADGDAGRDAEVPEHQRHRAREVLAVARARLRDEADECTARCGRRLVRVGEAAAATEPRLEGGRGGIRRACVAAYGDRQLRERCVRSELMMGGERLSNGATVILWPKRRHRDVAPEVEERSLLDELDRVHGLRLRELRRSRPRRVAPRGVPKPSGQAGGKRRETGDVRDQRRIACVEGNRHARPDEPSVRQPEHAHLLA